MFTLLAVTLLTYLQALASEKKRDWAWFGIAVGLGFLSQYIYLALPIALLAATFTIPTLSRGWKDYNGDVQKPRVRWLHILIVLASALVIVAPYGWWLMSNGHGIDTMISQRSVETDPLLLEPYAHNPLMDALIDRRDGALSLVVGLIAFSMPLLLIFAFLFWQMWTPFVIPFFPKRKVEEDETDIIWRQLLSRTMLFATGLYALAVVLGLSHMEPRWMHPVLAPLPIWLFLQVQRSGPYKMGMKALSLVTSVLIFLVMAGRILDWNEDIKQCQVERCRAYLPVGDYADALVTEGWRGGTIVGAEYQLTGNLRHAMPDARVLDAHFSYDAYPAPSQDTAACLAVWRNTPFMPDKLQSYLADMDVLVPDGRPQGAIRRYLLRSDEKASVLYYRYLTPTQKCR